MPKTFYESPYPALSTEAGALKKQNKAESLPNAFHKGEKVKVKTSEKKKEKS